MSFKQRFGWAADQAENAAQALIDIAGHIRLGADDLDADLTQLRALVEAPEPEPPEEEPVDPEPGPVSTVTVSPASVTMDVGQIREMSAVPRDQSGLEVEGVTVEWLSQHPDIATVDVDGIVEAIAPGDATIVAEADGVEGLAFVTVREPNDGGDPGGTDPPIGEYETIADHDFEDGTFGPFLNSQPTPVERPNLILDDPTGSGRGNVLQLDYSRYPGGTAVGNRSVERNIRIDSAEPIIAQPGDILDIEWDVNLGAFDPEEVGGFHNRKLVYVQDKRRGPAHERKVVSAVVHAEFFGVDYSGGSAGVGKPIYRSDALMQPNTWHRMRLELTMNSDWGTNDGIVRVWLDQALIIEGFDRGWLRAPGYQVHRIQMGTQHTSERDLLYEDIRWIDNIRIRRKLAA